MQSIIQNTKEKTDGILYLHVWKGTEKTSFNYYEDDGETYNYEKGNFYQRNIWYDALSNKMMLEKKEGAYASKFNKLKIILHGFDKTNSLDFDLIDASMIIDLKN